MLDHSWTLLVSLQYSVEKLAYAALYQAFKVSNMEVPVPEGKSFAELANMDQVELDGEYCVFLSVSQLTSAPVHNDIHHQYLETYEWCKAV